MIDLGIDLDTTLTDHAQFQRAVIIACAERFGWDVADYGDSLNLGIDPEDEYPVVFVLHGKDGLPEDSAGYAAFREADGSTNVRSVGAGLKRLIAEATSTRDVDYGLGLDTLDA